MSVYLNFSSENGFEHVPWDHLLVATIDQNITPLKEKYPKKYLFRYIFSYVIYKYDITFLFYVSKG